MNAANPPRRRLRLLLIMLPLALSALTLAAWLARGTPVSTVEVVRRDFVRSVVASGRVETPHRVSIGAQITGTVTRVPVTEGQSVRAGMVLVALDAAELLAVHRQAERGVVQAQARLRQMTEVQAPVAEQALRQARVTLTHAQAMLRRDEDLFARGFIGQAALDEAHKAVELADAQLRTAHKQLESAGPHGSDFAIAQASLAAAQAGAQAAQARVRYATIRAPVDGTLIARQVEVGDVVQPGKALMSLSPQGLPQLVVQIDERNLRMLAIGQRARVSADAFPGDRFDAELVYLNPGVNAQTGAVEVKLNVIDPPVGLRQDMTVSVDIEVARREQSLLAPLDAVHDADSAQPWVLRLEAGRARRQAVTLGLRAGGYAQVLQGLAEGDRLIPASVPVKTGARVRDAR